MRKLRLDFCDFWPGFKKTNNFFYNRIKMFFDVEITDDPEVVIFSVFGNKNWSYRCKKIQFIGENIRPGFLTADYSISFDHMSSRRNIRWPLYNLYYSPEEIRNVSAPGYKFCCVVTSNPKGKFRNLFFDRLSKRKIVDSGGRYRNNVGVSVIDKAEFLRQYRFSFAFENSSYPGYTTEKIVESKMAGTIPIYWGNPRIAEDFNRKAFVNVHDFKHIDDCIEFLLKIDSDDNLYRTMRDEPLVSGGGLTMYNDIRIFDEWIRRVIGDRQYFKNKHLAAVENRYNMLVTKSFDFYQSLEK